jgi:PmbA protein
MSADDRIVDEGLAALARARCDGEIYLESARSTRVAVSGGIVEALEVREDRGAGVRVFTEGRVGFSFTADLRPSGLERAVHRAREIAAFVAADRAHRLPENPGEPPADLPLCDPSLASVPVVRKIEMAKAAEEAGRCGDRRVSGVREASYQDAQGVYRLANTAGLRRDYETSRAIVSIELAASEAGESQTGWHAGWRVGLPGLDPDLVGREAARKASAKLGAQPASTRRTSVVLSPEVTASLFGELSGLFAADAVLKARSMLAGKIGERIASDVVTLVDDGRHPEGIATAPVDGEGVATRETVLIDGGVLRGYLQSTYTANRMNASVTGNALRSGYTSRPGISRTNLRLKPGPGSVRPADLLRDVSDGLYIMEVMGLHTINAVTGDFSLGASGLLLEGGKMTRPVDRMAIAGNIVPLLQAVQTVADDVQFLVTGVGATVLLRDMAVSGR